MNNIRSFCGSCASRAMTEVLVRTNKRRSQRSTADEVLICSAHGKMHVAFLYLKKRQAEQCGGRLTEPECLRGLASPGPGFGQGWSGLVSKSFCLPCWCKKVAKWRGQDWLLLAMSLSVLAGLGAVARPPKDQRERTYQVQPHTPQRVHTLSTRVLRVQTQERAERQMQVVFAIAFL